MPTTASVVKKYVYRYSRRGNRTSEQIDNAVTSALHNALDQVTSTSPSGPIRFEGTVNEPATVTVNGQPANVDGTGKFSADLPLSPGTHTRPTARPTRLRPERETKDQRPRIGF